MFLIRVWYGNDVSLLSFVVFGRICFVHVPKDERSKLDVQSKRCIFIRYGQDEFGYKCYDQVERKVIRSRDVVLVGDLTIQDTER